MERLIINRNNYEEVMFNILENSYTTQEQNVLLDQIAADTFLQFEWNQWKKLTLTESIEEYRFNNLEFIESLTQNEERKIVWMPKIAIAASVFIAIGLGYILFRNQQASIKNELVKNKTIQLENKSGNELKNTGTLENRNNTIADFRSSSVDTTSSDTFEVKSEKVVPKFVDNKLAISNFVDSIKAVAIAKKDTKKRKYKISVLEEKIDAADEAYTKLEKRYSISDLENGKDGITMQKFIVGGRSRIVNDLQANKKILEIYTKDNCVLEIDLSQLQ